MKVRRHHLLLLLTLAVLSWRAFGGSFTYQIGGNAGGANNIRRIERAAPALTVAYINGARSSGLTYTFTSLASAVDDVSFSNDGGLTFTYTPVANANGADPNVTTIRVNPKGSFNSSTSFLVRFRVRIT